MLSIEALPLQVCIFLECRHAPRVCTPVLQRDPSYAILTPAHFRSPSSSCRRAVPVTGALVARPRPLRPAPLSQAQVHKPEVRSLPRWVTKLSGSRERAGRVGSGATG